MDKLCTQCEKSKPEEEFYKAARNRGGREHQCKACRWQTKLAKPEAIKRDNLRYELKKYGLDEEQYRALCEAQGNACAICRKPDTERRLSVDHCHETGNVRGLLCNGCNRALGLLGDTLAGVRAALQYLDAES